MSEVTPLAAPIVRVRPAPRKHTIVVQIHDRPGALYRAVGIAASVVHVSVAG